MDYDNPCGKFGDCSFSCFSTVAFNVFLHFMTMWPWPLTFRPNINWCTRYRDGLSLCQVCRFFCLNHFGFIVRTDRQTDRQNHSQTPLNALLTRLDCRSSTWVINNNLKPNKTNSQAQSTDESAITMNTMIKRSLMHSCSQWYGV